MATAATIADSEKYFRTGIAMSKARKADFDKRIALLGMKTVGDLAIFFTEADGAVEALKPIAEQYLLLRSKTKTVVARRKSVAERLKNLHPDELARLIELAESTGKIEK